MDSDGLRSEIAQTFATIPVQVVEKQLFHVLDRRYPIVEQVWRAGSAYILITWEGRIELTVIFIITTKDIQLVAYTT